MKRLGHVSRRTLRKWLSVTPLAVVAVWLVMLNRLSPPPRPAEAVIKGGQNSARVFVADQRVLVADTSVLPYSAVGEVRAWWGTKGFSGTGAMIGADTVLTAAHCVYRPEMGGWADKVLFTPARNGTSEPYGTANATTFLAPSDYPTTRKQAVDIAVLTLDRPLGEKCGWVRVSDGGQSPEQLAVMSAGYPADKPGHQMYASPGTTASIVNGLLYTDLDAVFGQSGSPMWITDTDGQATLVAVLVAELDSGAANLAIPATQSLIDGLMMGEVAVASVGGQAGQPAEGASSVSSTSLAPTGLCGVGAFPMLVCATIGLIGVRAKRLTWGS